MCDALRGKTQETKDVAFNPLKRFPPFVSHVWNFTFYAHSIALVRACGGMHFIKRLNTYIPLKIGRCEIIIRNSDFKPKIRSGHNKLAKPNVIANAPWKARHFSAGRIDDP